MAAILTNLWVLLAEPTEERGDTLMYCDDYEHLKPVVQPTYHVKKEKLEARAAQCSLEVRGQKFRVRSQRYDTMGSPSACYGFGARVVSAN